MKPRRPRHRKGVGPDRLAITATAAAIPSDTVAVVDRANDIDAATRRLASSAAHSPTIRCCAAPLERHCRRPQRASAARLTRSAGCGTPSAVSAPVLVEVAANVIGVHGLATGQCVRRCGAAGVRQPQSEQRALAPNCRAARGVPNDVHPMATSRDQGRKPLDCRRSRSLSESSSKVRGSYLRSLV